MGEPGAEVEEEGEGEEAPTPLRAGSRLVVSRGVREVDDNDDECSLGETT